MTTLVITGLLLLAFTTRRDAKLIVITTMLVRIATPSQAAPDLIPFVQPATFYIIIASIAFITSAPTSMLSAVQKSHAPTLFALAFLALATTQILAGASPGSIGLALLEIIIAPFILYILARDVAHRSRDSAYHIIVAIILTCAAEVVLGQLQLNTGDAILWATAYERSWWWSEEVTRALGTTGHGLQFGLLMAMATPLTIWIKSIIVRLAAISLLLYGCVISSARLALIMCLIAALLVILSSNLSRIKNAAAAFCAIALVAYYAIGGEEVKAIINKFEDDNGSNQQRADAFRWAWDHKSEFMYSLYPGNKGLREAGVLRTSLENGYLALGLTFGLITVALLALFHIYLAASPILSARHVDRTLVCLTASAGIGLIGFQGFSSIATNSIEIWTFNLVAGIAAGYASASSALETAPSRSERAPTDTTPLEPWQRAIRERAR